jgi:4-hydroxy-2-oxoheptanedioate aldolase
VGPHDLSLSLDRAGEDDRDHMRQVISSVVARAVAAGIPIGVHALDGATAAGWAAEGATIVTATMDVTALAAALAGHLRAARGTRG